MEIFLSLRENSCKYRVLAVLTGALTLSLPLPFMAIDKGYYETFLILPYSLLY